MSVQEQSMEYVLNHVNMIPQSSGVGQTIETIYVIVDVTEVIDPSISDNFYLEIMIMAREKSYSMTGIYNTSDILEDGTIVVGILYVIGPIGRDEITYRVSIHYIVG